MYRLLGALVLLFSAVPSGRPQETAQSIKVEVHADQPDGPMIPIWNYFGYDEPNYTYSSNGKKLLGELAALSPKPAYVRVHNLLTTGDGSASLKWGSTNIYTEDAAGKPVYSWTILDRIFDTFRAAGIKPLVEIGFMPEALSTHPQPYRHNFPQGSVFTGWTYPPKDYQKWSEVVFQFVQHLRERYGDAEVKTWLWEVWNEPDIAYWQGTPEEFLKLYDYSADAILRALPKARVGGPDSTGPASPKAAEFLRIFLDHCAHQRNYATGKTGSRLDFISFHPKGSPTWQGDHVVMGIARQLASIEQGFKIVKSFPEWRDTPIILGESDPEGCAACSARTNPQNGYRNGALYAAYTAEAMNATYADEDVEAPAAPNDLVITGLPESMHLAHVEHFRIDAHHSNAFTAWKQMGFPQSPSPEQYDQLQSAGQLQLLTSPAWILMEHGEAHLQFTLPRQSLSLVRIRW